MSVNKISSPKASMLPTKMPKVILIQKKFMKLIGATFFSLAQCWWCYQCLERDLSGGIDRLYDKSLIRDPKNKAKSVEVAEAVV